MAGPPSTPEHGLTSRITFRCDLGEARAAARALRDFLVTLGLDETELFNCELCLTEACNNAVQHASPTGVHAPVVAAVSAHGAEIELTVTDHTPGFALATRAGPLSPDHDHGRGLFIIQSLMDEVSYFRGSRENTLVMRLARRAHPLPPPLPASAASDATGRQLAECRQTIGAMARELCFRSESLAAIFRCCSELGRTTDLAGFSQRLLGDLLHLAAADWFVLRLNSADGSRLAVFATSTAKLGGAPLPLAPRDASPGSAELAAAQSGRELEFATRLASPAVEPLCAAGPEATGRVHPLLFDEMLVGTLAVGHSTAGSPFSALQVEMIRTIAEFLAIHVVSARHQDEQLRAQLVAHELEIARRIQRALLPRALPQPPPFSLAASWESARQVGGDFYDALPLGEQSLLLVVADVMGNGVPAAMFATITRSLLRALAGRGHGPANLLRQLNELLYEELSAVGMFVTVQLVLVDLVRRQLVAASAGHCPILVAGGAAAGVQTLCPTGLPLGIMPDSTYCQQTLALADPGTLLLYTDGLTEAQNPAGEMFGQERLAEWLRDNFPLPGADQLRDRLSAEIGRFRDGAALHDDQAFLILAGGSVASAAPAPIPGSPDAAPIPSDAHATALHAGSPALAATD